MRELVEEKVIRVPFVGTADNLADFFTKAPVKSPQSWFAQRNMIMNVPARNPISGSSGRSTGGR